ncbi:MAG: hypothetical protein FWH33_11035 [Oscillospiraceae bacterium]|nr:hypothetical protein [Oscillospiraceae bacterium]
MLNTPVLQMFGGAARMVDADVKHMPPSSGTRVHMGSNYLSRSYYVKQYARVHAGVGRSRDGFVAVGNETATRKHRVAVDDTARD